jgi:hypothetical protein
MNNTLKFTPQSDIIKNILHDSKEEIEVISRIITNHFGGVEQDVSGVTEGLEKVIKSYLRKHFK